MACNQSPKCSEQFKKRSFVIANFFTAPQLTRPIDILIFGWSVGVRAMEAAGLQMRTIAPVTLANCFSIVVETLATGANSHKGS